LITEMRFTQRIHTDQVLIFLIIATGAILRFYNYSDIPFTHDEFSAVFRTQFGSFHELIAKGVLIDTHPAGVQVFLYYWVMLFGISEPIVKLPFTLFSLAAVYMLYLIGKKWFSSAAGLLAACFLSFLQYPVMYGQIARPYASGLFLVLLMVYFWTNLMLSPHKKYYLNLTGYILVSALCCYNHHFTLLFCGIAGLTGIFIIEKNRRLSFVLSWIVVLLLYIPHFPVFFSQLKQGGIGGWLGKPKPDFLFDYMAYVFQFSSYVFALLLLLLILGLAWRMPRKRTDKRFVLVSFLWFFLPLLVGFLYSLFINPVLQYSVLIFSFPFLLLLLFFYAGAERAWQKGILTGLSALVIIPSLVYERKHYELFYNSPYREILEDARQACDSLGSSNCFVLLDSHRRITDYYLGKPGMKGFKPGCMHDIFEPPVIANIVDTCRAKYFIYGCISNSGWEDYQVIRAKYPYLLRHRCLNEGDFYVFSKDSVAGPDEYYFRSDADFTSDRKGWVSPNPSAVWFDGEDVQIPVFYMDSSIEFSPTFRGSLRDICRHRNDVIDFSADVETGSRFTVAYLQLGIYRKDILQSFYSADIDGKHPGGFRRIFCSCRLADIDWKHHSLYVQGFIWNRWKQDLVIRSMSFRVRHGNPFLYGLYTKIEK